MTTGNTQILQLTRTSPDQPTNGHERRVLETSKKLSEFGDVLLGIPSPSVSNPEPGIETFSLKNPLLAWKPTRIYAWNLSFILGSSNPFDSIQTTLSKRSLKDINNISLVVCEEPQLFSLAYKTAKACNAPLLINKHDYYADFLEQRASSLRVPTLIINRISTNLSEFEQKEIELADSVVFVSEKDRQQFEIPESTVSDVIPNGTNISFCNIDKIDPDYSKMPVTRDSPIAIFIGSYDYDPNKDAAETIVNKVAPELPEVEFLLVGRDPPDILRENVHALGFVDNLETYLAASDIGLCPLMFGGGTKLKMFDYLAAGLPVVTTSVGAEGINVSDGESVLIRDNFDNFIKAISTLLENKELRGKLAQNAKSTGKNYHWENAMKQYDPVIKSLIQL